MVKHNTYSKSHTQDECDKCLKNVGKKNLKPIPFIYLDKNDNKHPDMTPIIKDRMRQEAVKNYGNDNVLFNIAMMRIPKMENGYRQYFICKECFEKGF